MKTKKPFIVHPIGVAGAVCTVVMGCSDYEFGQITFPTIVDTAILFPYEPGPDSSGPSPIDTSVMERCDGEEDLAQTVGWDSDCQNEVVTGSIGSVLEWEIQVFEEQPDSSHVVMAPVIGQLTDDNGDGVIDSDDMPDIVVVTDDAGVDSVPTGFVRIIAGDGSSVRTLDHWNTPEGPMAPYRYSNLALGDIDGDGEPEIAVVLLPHHESGGPHEDTPIFPSPHTGGDDGEG